MIRIFSFPYGGDSYPLPLSALSESKNIFFTQGENPGVPLFFSKNSPLKRHFRTITTSELQEGFLVNWNMRSHERYQWAAEIFGVNPHDHVLEIGCETNLAVEQIAPLLDTGKVTAIDRSPLAIAKAVRRNAGFVRSGKRNL